jgi:hypothetical protein
MSVLTGTPFAAVETGTSITIAGAANAENNGTYTIEKKVSSKVVKLLNTAMVTAAAGPSITLGSPDPIGPFVANPTTTTANAIAVDVAAPKGLFYANDSGGLNDVSCSSGTLV